MPGNSARLATILAAFPASKVSFLAERNHLSLVRENLKMCQGKDLHRVDWVEISVPSRRLTSPGMWRAKVHTLHTGMKLVRTPQADLVFFQSLSGVDLLPLKYLLLLRHRKLRILAVLHTVLTNISGSRWSLKAITFRKALTLGNRSLRIKYVVHSPAIREMTLRILPGLASFMCSFYEPSLFGPETSGDIGSDFNKGVRFGFLGADTPGKGYDLYIRLASDVVKKVPNAKFRAIGHSTRRHHEGAVVEPGLSSEPLSVEEFSRRIGEIDYAIFPYSALRYAYTASGAILDAFGHLKPCIMLRTPVFEDLLRRMGNIGYICDSYNELRDLLVELASTPRLAEYEAQRQAILRGRGIFEPHHLASELKQCVLHLMQ